MIEYHKSGCYVDLKGAEIFVNLRHDRRAKNLILRVVQNFNIKSVNQVVVTVPSGVYKDEVLQFVVAKADWILERVSKLLPPRKFAHGSVIPYLGVSHLINHEPEGRRGVWKTSKVIHVSGGIEFLERRLLDWLKKQARIEIEARVILKALIIAKKPGRISIRDPRSRWGSCSATNNLNFSWRLIMAPDFVLDYVVAHEVAHMKEHNHSKAFWLVTDQLCTKVASARAWLKGNGEILHSYR